MEPFLGSAAIRRGELTRRGLARRYVPVYRDVYVSRDIELTARIRAQAAWLSSGATLAGVSAAAVHGAKWLNPDLPAEIIRADRHAQAGMAVHTWKLGAGQTCSVSDIECTTPARTAFDLGRRYTETQAVALVDALMNATGVSIAEVMSVAAVHPGARGIVRLRAVLDLVDGGAESPRESRLRLLLIRAGLPRPETQIAFRDLRIRVDMGWRRWQVAVEYDGAQHWTDPRQRSWDIDRIALLEEAGWAVVRVSAEMMSRPVVVIERVRAKLRAAGCPL